MAIAHSKESTGKFPATAGEPLDDVDGNVFGQKTKPGMTPTDGATP